MQYDSVERQLPCILSAALFALAAGCQPNTGAPNEVGRLSQAVQTGYLNRGFEYWTTPDLGLQATGALFLTLRNPDGSPKVIPGTSLNARASCGLTFISPRYAITAAHCVSETDIPNPEIQSFAVQTYDTRNLQVDRIPTAVTGKFPNYSHGHLQLGWLRCHPVQPVLGREAMCQSLRDLPLRWRQRGRRAHQMCGSACGIAPCERRVVRRADRAGRDVLVP